MQMMMTKRDRKFYHKPNFLRFANRKRHFQQLINFIATQARNPDIARCSWDVHDKSRPPRPPSWTTIIWSDGAAPERHAFRARLTSCGPPTVSAREMLQLTPSRPHVQRSVGVRHFGTPKTAAEFGKSGSMTYQRYSSPRSQFVSVCVLSRAFYSSWVKAKFYSPCFVQNLAMAFHVFLFRGGLSTF